MPGTGCIAPISPRRLQWRRGSTSPQRPKMVGTTGLEPVTLWSQTRCATKLRYVPMVRSQRQGLPPFHDGFETVSVFLFRVFCHCASRAWPRYRAVMASSRNAVLLRHDRSLVHRLRATCLDQTGIRASRAGVVTEHCWPSETAMRRTPKDAAHCPLDSPVNRQVLAKRTGLEPVASGVTGRCSNQLN